MKRHLHDVKKWKMEQINTKEIYNKVSSTFFYVQVDQLVFYIQIKWQYRYMSHLQLLNPGFQGSESELEKITIIY